MLKYCMKSLLHVFAFVFGPSQSIEGYETRVSKDFVADRMVLFHGIANVHFHSCQHQCAQSVIVSIGSVLSSSGYFILPSSARASNVVKIMMYQERFQILFSVLVISLSRVLSKISVALFDASVGIAIVRRPKRIATPAGGACIRIGYICADVMVRYLKFVAWKAASLSQRVGARVRKLAVCIVPIEGSRSVVDTQVMGATMPTRACAGILVLLSWMDVRRLSGAIDNHIVVQWSQIS